MPLVRNYKRTGRATESTTLREFDGGWNVVDSDLNLSSRFAPLFDNWMRAPDGTAQIRFGTRHMASVAPFMSRMVNMTYFKDALVVVGTNGVIVGIDGAGNVTLYFDEAVAASLPGSPSGWSTTFFVSFSEFNGDLIIGNGVNKPLIVYSDQTVEYLNDLATGSNVNTPTARFVITASRYLIMSGDLLDEDAVYISNIDTSGTHVGDGAPNDAVTIQTGSVVTSGASKVKGITWFRNRLIIMFNQVLAIYVLGEYDSSGNHVPRLEDVVEHHGSVSHRAIAKTFDDVLFPETSGVSALSKALFTGTLQPDRESQLIDPAVVDALDHLTTTSLEDDVFSLFNVTDNQYWMFTPDHPKNISRIETPVYVYTNIKKIKVEAWTRFRGWNFHCGAVSAGDRVFLGGFDTEVFYYLGEGDFTHGNPSHGDYIDYAETFDDDTVFSDSTGFLVTATQKAASSYDVSATGLPIRFDWHLPWGDFDTRQRLKKSKFIHVEAKGKAKFSVDWFTDNNIIDRTFLGETFSDGTPFTDAFGFTPYTDMSANLYDPALTINMIGGDSLGFGGAGFGKDFGGSINTNDERLIKWPTKFKVGKFRFHGQTRESLNVISIGMVYSKGSIYR
jgi:hypothetical protein|tara:strand:- start:1102 stop:2949 length:1848 start_codon:yes stop_codon:yes gene_type:complete